MGAGTNGKLVDRLTAEMQKDEHLILICGSNENLHRQMLLAHGDKGNVTVLRSVNNMPLYLKACDVVYTKPGGLTSTEAAVAGIPIVHTKPIPGCETKNRAFFRRNKMSVTAYTDYGLAKKGLKLLRNPELGSAMTAAASCTIDKQSAEKIYQFVVKKYDSFCVKLFAEKTAAYGGIMLHTVGGGGRLEKHNAVCDFSGAALCHGDDLRGVCTSGKKGESAGIKAGGGCEDRVFVADQQ